MRFTLLILCSFLFALPIEAKEDPAPYQAKSPLEAIDNHLANLQRDNYHPELAARSFRPDVLKGKDAERLAIQLKQILDGKGIYIDYEEVPQKAGYVDSLTGKHRYVLSETFPRIYVTRRKGLWYYSESTIDAIPELHRQVFPFGLNRLLNAIPESWHTKVLGLEIGQWLGLLMILLVGFLTYRLFKGLGSYLINRVLHRFNKEFIAPTRLKRVAKPLSWYMVTLIVAKLVPVLLLPIEVSQYLIKILESLGPLFMTLVFYHMVSLISEFFAFRALKTESTLDDQLIPLLRKIVKVVVVLVGTGYILHKLGVDILPYLAGLSVGGIAIALAAQDTMKNLLGSVMIFVDRPFQIGDWISYSGMDGTVEEVGFRTTRIRTFYNSVLSVPNGKIADNMVDNFGLRAYRRYSTKLSITYDTPPELIEVFVEGLRELVRNHQITRKDYFEVHLNELGESSLQIIFYIFFECKTWSEELKARHEVLIGVLELAKELGVRFAFPTQTLHIEEAPGQGSLTPTYDKGQEAFNKAMEDYVKAYKERMSN